MTSAHLAVEDYETELDTELGRAGVAVVQVHGLLRVCEGPAVHAAWAANTWWEVERIPIESIGHAARELRARQRNWALYAPEHRGRGELVVDKLPYVSAKPLELGEPGSPDAVGVAPDAPLGSFTLLDRDTVLASARCTSPFPNGEPSFAQDRTGPPSRAYLKLWEVFARLRRTPRPGDRCLDLGASPGGWTWLLAHTGADVLAVDKAPLEPRVAARPNIAFHEGSAFAIEPDDPAVFDGEPVDWWCSDIIAYPDRLRELAARWLASGRVRNLVCTVKLQGATDHDAVAKWRALPGAQVVHLHHNKHELTCIVTAAAG